MKKLTVLLSLVMALLAFAGCQLPGNGSSAAAETTVPPTVKSKIVLPLTDQTATEIALEHAGISNNAVSHLHVRQDTDGGITHYDVDFRYGDYYYAYEIHEQTGEILKLETEYERTEIPKVQLEANAVQAIALENAGFTAQDVTKLVTEFDRDDHRYEVEFVNDGIEYTYEICAETGKILDIDKERDD